ncbi:MAG TPA: hypothetical protein O0X99_01645 [Methanocorpusculum sp.]|nr:hypothetical protein [Methanocorpusculum sp.]
MSVPNNGYSTEIEYLSNKSLILENPSDMDPVLYFYFIDTVSHLDYTLSSLAYNSESIRCIMTAEHLIEIYDDVNIQLS